eukprot:CAMPEP_0114589262 /NCGR_PEP_ID=MMETSP0125-20121206/11754_1 /TAXON_ID=485358 ORGANISM="Aristerostoma sp., Strain ATCC 50986" /NCGR_SAMPLE_ID=MMETSP0125 /ASSEMBLY_ACC=CAM_ASM_000245 /LENGTH=68 /DNA_ID=CAMNT_0001786061 /DNA_START=1076 /DNA_END=1282 /DNA_ORIENTATION=-
MTKAIIPGMASMRYPWAKLAIFSSNPNNEKKKGAFKTPRIQGTKTAKLIIIPLWYSKPTSLRSYAPNA